MTAAMQPKVARRNYTCTRAFRRRAYELHPNAFELHLNCVWIAFELHLNCILIAFESHSNCIWIAFELHLNSDWIAFELLLKCIWQNRHKLYMHTRIARSDGQRPNKTDKDYTCTRAAAGRMAGRPVEQFQILTPSLARIASARALPQLRLARSHARTKRTESDFPV